MINVEKVVIDYLTEKLDIPVDAEIPNNEPQSANPDEFVVVESTSGTYDHNSKLGNHSLVVQAYAQSRAQASNIAIDVADKLTDIADGDNAICKADVGVPYNFSDEFIRYQLTLDLISQG